MRKLTQRVGPLVPDLPSFPIFSVLGLTFPLAGLVRILLRSKDGFCFRGEKSFVGDMGVGALQLTIGVLDNVDVNGHAQGVYVVSLDDDRDVDSVDGVESCAALFEMFEKSGGEDVGVKCGGVAQIAYPHVVNNGKDEGGGATDAHAIKGVILNLEFPDGLDFSGLVYGVLKDRGIQSPKGQYCLCSH